MQARVDGYKVRQATKLGKSFFCYISYYSMKLVCFVISHWIGRKNLMRIGLGRVWVRLGRVWVLTLPFMAAAFSAASSLSRFAWDMGESKAYGVRERRSTY
jgi:hypothetical protein